MAFLRDPRAPSCLAHQQQCWRQQRQNSPSLAFGPAASAPGTCGRLGAQKKVAWLEQLLLLLFLLLVLLLPPPLTRTTASSTACAN